MMSKSRIDRKFAELKQQGRAALVTFISAGDPDYETSMALLKGLGRSGADIIELGMPFSDPMADGPTIQLSSQRALAGGQTMQKTLEMAHEFRRNDSTTPLVLMGYYNPIYQMGCENFLKQAVLAGIDGLIVVDLPPEVDDELCVPARKHGINFIRLATPTTTPSRLPVLLEQASGFIYYVSIKGITGTATFNTEAVEKAIAMIKEQSDLPVAVGFGVKTPEQVKSLSRVADGIVVGSAIIEEIVHHMDKGQTAVAEAVFAKVNSLAAALHSERSLHSEKS